jgi:hypothetical protein
MKNASAKQYKEPKSSIRDGSHNRNVEGGLNIIPYHPDAQDVLLDIQALFFVIVALKCVIPRVQRSITQIHTS